MREINLNGLINLLDKLVRNRADIGLYNFKKYRIRISPLVPLSNNERIKQWYKFNPQKVKQINIRRKKKYHQRKRKGLCIKCTGTEKSTYGILCTSHYLKKKKYVSWSKKK